MLGAECNVVKKVSIRGHTLLNGQKSLENWRRPGFSPWNCLVLWPFTHLSGSPQYGCRVSCQGLRTSQTKRQAWREGWDCIKKFQWQEHSPWIFGPLSPEAGLVATYSDLQIPSAWVPSFWLGSENFTDKKESFQGRVVWYKVAPAAGILSAGSGTPQP